MYRLPHAICKKANGRIVKEHIDNAGHLQVYLSEQVNGRTVQHKYYKHRVIATQFIENPNDYDCADYINRNKLYNTITNLRCCTVSDNSKKKSSTCRVEYEFFDDIDEAVVVNDYGKHQFEN